MFAIRARRKVATERDFLDAVVKVVRQGTKFSSTYVKSNAFDFSRFHIRSSDVRESFPVLSTRCTTSLHYKFLSPMRVLSYASRPALAVRKPSCMKKRVRLLLILQSRLMRERRSVPHIQSESKNQVEMSVPNCQESDCERLVCKYKRMCVEY